MLGPMLMLVAVLAQARSDIVIADFEGKDYGGWTVSGEAFGTGPARGTLPGQMQVSGFLGRGLVSSFNQGDGATGTLMSPPFTLARKYINFLMGGGMHPGETCMNLLVDGRTVRTATGPNDKPGGTERLDWQTWDVAELEGKTVRIEIVDRATGGWGHINVDQITQSDRKEVEEISTAVLYNETYRPQFHFTAKAGWLNDPNGLVWYAGEYHLFFQHNPLGINWGNMTWGHAVSPDLVHWTQLPNAIEPDSLGTIFSGSAVVDRENTAGFQKGREKTLVAIYTAAGGTNPESKGKPFTQCIAYSTDRGRTWTKYAGNPVLAHIAAENRDPKVVWHAPTHKWIMALFLDGNEYALFSSPDLKSWTKLQSIVMKDCGECPDFFEMAVEGEPGAARCVFTAANGRYLVGRFDGQRFTPETDPLIPDYGANYYAVQSYSNTPDGRRIQIAWMTGGSYPKMPFNQQMSFPCAMTLHRTAEGLRLYRWPVKEIARLTDPAAKPVEIRNRALADEPIKVGSGELWDVEAEFELKDASEVGLRVRGQAITYSARDHRLRCLGREAPLEPESGRVRIRALVDRASIETFGNGGRVSLTSCFLPRQREKDIEAFATGGTARIVKLSARPLKSAWK